MTNAWQKRMSFVGRMAVRHDKGYVLNTRATFHERLRVLFIPDNHIKGSRENGCIYLIFFFACEQSLIFLYKVTAREINPSTQAPSRDKWGRNIMIIKVVPIPYCNITSWFAIAMAEIRTRGILREKEDCKQSINFLNTLDHLVNLLTVATISIFGGHSVKGRGLVWYRPLNKESN